MTICPVAIAAGCKKCPMFKVCPLKTVLGDQKPGGGSDSDSKKSPGGARKS